MALAQRVGRTKVLMGHDRPRVAPPIPLHHELEAYRAAALGMGITYMPWQEVTTRYLTARGRDGLLLYREVCAVVARQNGKTTLVKPLIVQRLRAGRKIMHIAQNRELPRYMFGVIADAIAEQDEKLLPRRRGRIIWPRYGSGQEEIQLVNGGSYRIAAASRGGARGHPNDDVIIDELREMTDFDVMAAAEPTITMSADPQIIYLSNAGDDDSIVLNSVRDRAGKDESLAYLEWSADPSRSADDRQGWAEANPALGYYPSVMRTLESAYRKYELSGKLAIFETEHLCRWVPTMRERLVDEAGWAGCAGPLPAPKRPYLGISMAPDGSRASAAVAWQLDPTTLGLQLIFDVTGSPIDVAEFGRDLRQRALKLGVVKVGFDPQTDAELAKYFTKPKSIAGQEYANASALFVSAIAGRRVRWADAEQVTDDLVWTARKPHDESGAFQAVRAKDDRPITAALAAIRAVFLASGPPPVIPKVM